MSDDAPKIPATLSPAQAVQLMALGVLVRDGDISLSGEDAEKAAELLIDVSQEIALQYGDGEERPKAQVINLAAVRFDKNTDASEHSPRDALEAAMAYLEDPEMGNPNHIIVCLGRTPEDGGSATKWFQAGSYEYHAQMGLLFETQQMIRDNG